MSIVNNTPRTLSVDGTNNNASVSEKHLDTTNVLFCDGHVKAVKLDFLNKRVGASGSDANAWKYFTIEDD